MALYTTQAFVLNHMPYKDNSRLVRCYTAEFGFLTFLVSGLGKPKSMMKTSYLYPLTLLSVAFHHTQNKDIFRPKDVQLSESFSAIHTDIIKSSIVQYMAELTFRVVQQTHEKDEILFSHLHQYMSYLQQLDTFYCLNIPCHFTCTLVSQMGVAPDTSTMLDAYTEPHTREHIELMQQFLHQPYTDIVDRKLTNAQRSWMLQYLIKYYNTQFQQQLQLNSLEVLKLVLD
jgi:DNA repair protein RecO (recombination protein O)